MRVFEVGGAPRSLATDGADRVAGGQRHGCGGRVRIAGVTAVASGELRPVVGGNGGRADLLVASDLPLQGDSRLSRDADGAGDHFVLREHGFRAGRFRIAYQSCDDALPSTGRVRRRQVRRERPGVRRGPGRRRGRRDVPLGLRRS